MPPGKQRKTFAIIGAGIVGCALAKLLVQKGYLLEAVASRSRATAHHAVGIIGVGAAAATPTAAANWASIVFITTPDRAIHDVCAQIAADHGFRPGATVIHCSGALPADALAPARDCGAAIASLHPLQTFASVEAAVKLIKGTAFAFEGDRDAEPVCADIVRALEGQMFHVPAEAKAVYHAAACVASNYLVTLVHAASRLMESAGLPHEVGTQVLLPLLEGTLHNIGVMGDVEALTGPIARGDEDTVRRHLDALAALPPELADLYRSLAVHTVQLARLKGTLRPQAAQRLLGLLQEDAPSGGDPEGTQADAEQ